MMTFRIDHGPKITTLASASAAWANPETEQVSRVPEPVRPSLRWLGPRVVEVSKALSRQKPLQKVSNREKASTAARSRAPRTGARSPRVPPEKAAADKRASRAPNAGTTRAGTKTARVLELLKRPGGATLKQLMMATKWQAHSVRGFLSAILKKKMGLTVESIRRTDGARRYSIKA